MVNTFGVTSSPMLPSPRVEPCTRRPCSYTNDSDSPSIFNSTLYATASSTPLCNRAAQSCSSPSENTSPIDSIGTACGTLVKAGLITSPTACVGESG